MLILTNRFLLKPLTVNDVGSRYEGWLADDKTSQFISARVSIFELKKYVMDRSVKKDVLFLGIFERYNGLHIGNIKYEPVNSDFEYAVMGILIGEKEWRGKGVAAEVIRSTAEWLRIHKKIKRIVLGVDNSNNAAISAYKKIGFADEPFEFLPPPAPNARIMVFHI